VSMIDGRMHMGGMTKCYGMKLLIFVLPEMFNNMWWSLGIFINTFFAYIGFS